MVKNDKKLIRRCRILAIDGVASFNMLRIICISYLSASVGKRESLTTADSSELNSCLLCSINGCKALSRFDCSSSICWSALGVIHPLIAIIRPYNTKATTFIPLVAIYPPRLHWVWVKSSPLFVKLYPAQSSALASALQWVGVMPRLPRLPR